MVRIGEATPHRRATLVQASEEVEVQGATIVVDMAPGVAVEGAEEMMHLDTPLTGETTREMLEPG